MSFLKNLFNTHKTQLVRFARIAVVTFFAGGVFTASGYNKDALVAAAVGALEVAWRAVFPADPAPTTPGPTGPTGP